ncbi:uncharacterized protein LOC107051782 [Gallus gallus]|uniref:uncharacterized protein LOC107051782 n=1 Tax=Gallus gallus TaxID=9031 RepID=UPI001EFFC10E|nr:uncharacterized protein LOC107051782 [Gallus gallus]
MSFQVKLPSAPPRSGREGSAEGVNFFLPPVPPGPSQRPAAAPPPPAPPRRSRRHPAARRRGVPHARSRRRRGSWFAEPPEEGQRCRYKQQLECLQHGIRRMNNRILPGRARGDGKQSPDVLCVKDVLVTALQPVLLCCRKQPLEGNRRSS